MDKIEIETRVLSERLSMLGSSQQTREAVGLFALSWTIFENTFELLMGNLKGHDVEGIPWTDHHSGVATWLKAYPTAVSGLPRPAVAVGAEDFCSAASMLGDYRHAVFHGFYLYGLSQTVRNPAWPGTKRKRATHVADLSPRVLNMAAIASDYLTQYALEVLKVIEGSEPEVRRKRLAQLATAKSYASEVRHLTELMNHEKA